MRNLVPPHPGRDADLQFSKERGVSGTPEAAALGSERPGRSAARCPEGVRRHRCGFLGVRAPACRTPGEMGAAWSLGWVSTEKRRHWRLQGGGVTELIRGVALAEKRALCF